MLFRPSDQKNFKQIHRGSVWCNAQTKHTHSLSLSLQKKSVWCVYNMEGARSLSIIPSTLFHIHTFTSTVDTSLDSLFFLSLRLHLSLSLSLSRLPSSFTHLAHIYHSSRIHSTPKSCLDALSRVVLCVFDSCSPAKEIKKGSLFVL